MALAMVLVLAKASCFRYSTIFTLLITVKPVHSGGLQEQRFSYYMGKIGESTCGQPNMYLFHPDYDYGVKRKTGQTTGKSFFTSHHIIIYIVLSSLFINWFMLKRQRYKS